MNEESLLYYAKENMDLKQEVKHLTDELVETNKSALALIKELERSNKELLVNDREKTKFLEKLKRSNKEQMEKIKAQEEALIMADKMASLGHLVAGVAHEINNPTTFIRSNIELIKKYWTRILNSIDIKQQEEVDSYILGFEECLDTMYRGTDRIMDIVNGLKFFARQEKVVYDAVNLNQCINDAYKLVKNEFISYKIDFEIISEEENNYIYGSRQQIEQIFINLLINSVDAIKNSEEKKSGKVTIHIKRVAKRKKFVIRVKDNGCGIAEENLTKIFDPFYTTNQASGGTGLGLSVVYGIVNEHGGSIEAKSTKGMGAEILLTLPEYKFK